jgi:ribosomal protein S18 acetylase RimI-like enzyme
MEILKADKRHIPDIVFLNAFVQRIHAAQHPEVFKPVGNEKEVARFFNNVLGRDENHMFIAFDERTPVGYLWATLDLRPENPFKYQLKQVYIHHLAVHEEYRHQHIGKALFKEIQNLANQNDIKHFALDTWAFNKDAHLFFEKLGFVTYRIDMWKKTE